MSSLITFGNSSAQILTRWTAFKATVIAKSLQVQYVEDSIQYIIFAIDQGVIYTTDIYKGTFTDPSYSQGQNDSDKADFIANYQTVANKSISQQVTSGNAPDGYSATNNPLLVAGKSVDGYVRTLKTDTSGQLYITGTITAANPSVGTDGSAIPTSSTLIGASDGTNLQQLLVESAAQRNLRISIFNGATEVSVTGANALKVDGSAVTQPVSGTITANAGSGTFTVSGTVTANIGTSGSLALDASVTGLQVSQGSTTSGQKGSLFLGAVTTAAPTYTTAQSSPLSLTTAGALRVDNSAVTQPVSGTITANQGGSWTTTVTQATAGNLNATVVGSGNFTVVQATAANLNATVTGTVAATQSGTWTVQPGNTANTTAWLIADSLAIGSTTSGQKGSLAFGATTTAAPSYTTAQSNPLSLTTSGLLRVDGSGATQPVSGTVTANAGSGTFTVSGAVTANIGTSGSLALDASVTGLQVSQGSTTSGQKGGLTLGAVTTAAPAYTTAQSSPLSLTTGGLLRVDASGTTVPVSGTVTATNPSVSTTGSAPPASATYIGGSVTTAAPSYTTGQMSALSLTTAGLLRTDGSGTTQPVSGTVTANAGSGTFTVSGTVTANIGTSGSLALDATSAKLTIAQGTALGSNTQALIGGSVTTASPTYTTGQISPLSLDTTGALRVNLTAGGSSGSVADKTAFTYGTTSELVIGGVFQDTSPTLSAGTSGAIRLTTNRGVHVNLRDASGNEKLGSSTSANSIPVVIASDQGSYTVAATQSGTWTVQPGNTQNTTAWLIADSLAIGSTTSGQKGSLAFGATTTAAPTYTTAQSNPLSLTTAGALRVDGSGTTQPISGTVTANAGTGTFTVSGTVTANIGTSGSLALDASVTGLQVSQGSTTSGQKGGLTLGAVTTAAPAYTTAQSSPLSLTTTGLLRTDGSGVTQPVSGTITANIGTSGSLALDATLAKLTIAQGTALGANTQAMVGGSVTTAAPTYTTGQISPLSLTTAGALRTDASGTTQPVSGTITANQGGTWTVQPGNTANTTPWLTTINQGSNSASVKAASTAAVATDPALVVAVSPNNTLFTTTADVTASGALGALNAAVQLSTSGLASVGMQLAAGTLIGTITPEVSYDSGTTWNSAYFSDPGTGALLGTIVFGSSNTATAKVLVVAGGSGLVRVRVSAYTSGTANILLRASNIVNPITLYAGLDGLPPPPIVLQVGGFDGTNLQSLSTDTSGRVNVNVIAALPTGANTIGAVTQASGPWTNNVTQFGSVNISTGTGASGTGIPRVTVANDSNILATQSGTWTVAQGTAAALSGRWPVIITDGTNSMPTLDTVGRAGFLKITDGTNTAAVKAASTPAAATDPALVVAISPGSPAAAGIDTTGTLAALGALNNAASVAVAGQNAVGMFLAAGTLIGTITPEISMDGGTTWVSSLFTDPSTGAVNYTIVFASSNTATTKNIAAAGGSTNVRVRVSAYTSGTANCTLRATQIVNNNNMLVGQYNSALPTISSGYTTYLQTDSNGRVITAPAGTNASTAGFAVGSVVTSATTNTAVRASTYNEQAANAQRSVSSSSANDASAGTGARTIKIIYYDSTGAGPSSETITMNGTTAVNTVSTTICFIESIQVLTAGTTGSNVGTITLFIATAAGGGTLATINATDNQTIWAHHYTPTGKTTYITGLSGNNTNNSNGSVITIRAKSIGVANSAEELVSDYVRVGGGTAQPVRQYGTPIAVVGPARILSYSACEGTASITTRVSFDFYDQ